MLFGWLRRRQAQATGDEIVQGPHSAEVYHDAARHFLDVQISTLDTLNTQLTQYLSIASLSLPVAVGLLNLTAPQHKPLPAPARWLLVAALVFYVSVLVFAWLASRIRGLEYRPDIPTAKAHSEEISGVYLKQWVANEYEASTTENKRVLAIKARWVGAEAVAFYVEGLCLSIAAVLTVLL